MLKLFKQSKIFFPVILITLWFILLVVNHIPGTYLSGWDTLHPEFNFSNAIERGIFGVFRNEQGLGAVAAHSHMADLPRIFLLLISSLVLPTDFLRYFFINFCILVGILGVYFFSKKVLAEKVDDLKVNTFSFLGTLFYLFNLGTLQHFYVPFEMFATQYALLPWLFLFSLNYLQDKKRSTLLSFGLVSLLSVPMAFAATLWYAYFLALFLFLLPQIKTHFKSVVVLVATTLVINSFWLLPNLYFVISGNAAFIPEARINKIFSEEAFNLNKSYGNITDTLLFKNFLFDWNVYSSESQKFDYLLGSWSMHLNNFWITLIGYLMSVVVLIGVITTFFKKNPFTKNLILPLLLSLIFILNLSQPFDLIFSLIRESSSLLKEALRFPFTKFSIILMFTASIFFTIGQLQIFNLLNQFIKSKKVIYLQTILIAILLVIYCLPMFKGELISKYMQVKIPNQYFEMFKFFETKDKNARIANLPIHSFWGWIYYDWGFQGAQFLSFGIKQPLLDRDYDRWNKGNEKYYRELSYAVYSQDVNLLKSVLQKYQVKYLLVDKNVIAPSTNPSQKALFFNEIELLLNSSKDFIQLEKNFGNLLVYKVDLENSDLVFSPKTFVFNSSTLNQEIDWAYKEYGDYATTLAQTKRDKTVFYPFSFLTDNQNIVNEKIVTLESNKLLINTNSLGQSPKLYLENFLENESYLPATVKLSNSEIVLDLSIPNSVSQLKYPLNPLSSGSFVLTADDLQSINFEVTQNKDLKKEGSLLLSTKLFNNLAIYKESDVNPQVLNLPLDLAVLNCSKEQEDQIVGGSREDDNSYQIIAKNAKACLGISVKELIKNDVEKIKVLLNLAFNVSSDKEVKVGYCLFNKSLGRCIKEEVFSTNKKEIDVYTSFDQDILDNLELVVYLDNENNKLLKEVKFSDFSYKLITPDQIISISPAEIKNSLANFADVSSKLELKLQNSIESSWINLSQINNEQNDCNDIKAIKSGKNTNRIENYIEYSSIKGSSCDFFSFPNLPHNSGYLVVLEAQNLKGLPLRVCIANNFSKRCDLYSALPKNDQLKKYLLLVPPVNDGGAGFNIHIDNYAVGSIESKNRIKNLQVIPFPYNFVTSSEFVTDNFSQVTSNLKVKSYKQLNPALVEVNIEGKGLLALGRSFDRGWVAFSFKKGLLGNHTTVNNWANGWVIDNVINGKIYIFFLPQLLLFIGLGGIIFYLGYLLKSGVRKLLRGSFF